METFLGTPEDATAVPEPRKVRPANSALKGRLMSIFARSLAAANAFPLTLQVLCSPRHLSFNHCVQQRQGSLGMILARAHPMHDCEQDREECQKVAPTGI